MRPELRWGIAAIIAFTIGVSGAEPYARLVAPFYSRVDRWITLHRPWEVVDVRIGPGKTNLTAELQLEGNVYRYQGAPNRAARVVGRVQVGEVIETPLVFWTFLIMWPATSLLHRVIRLVIGIPIFLALEALTTATQLVLPMAQASAILAGDPNPVTAWDRWSRFLEAGGQFAVAAALAVVVAAATRRLPRLARADAMPKAGTG